MSKEQTPLSQNGQSPTMYNEPPPAYPGNYNQPGGYPAQRESTGYGTQQSNPTVVVTGQPTVLIQQFREAPVRTHCQSCGADILTSTHYETGTMTWVVAGVMCIIGLWIGCCLIPFILDACKDVIHTCPSCHKMVGRYNRMN
ncbi:LITAF domain-containing protein-like [Mytilus californianus]|uniref:LITAF domain-containing protein-like n=1 Tax=Mytilus californianus TaxID=6549 RepID=UPI002247C08A|nr:LITAF domain-containing protein-like [Mytilus californianus]